MKRQQSAFSKVFRKLIPVLGVVLGACAAGLPAPTTSDESHAQSRWPDASLAELESGRSLYVQKCAGCHALKSPSAVPADQWASEVAEMRAKKGVALTDDESQAIIRYLWAMGSRPAGAQQQSRR